MQVSFSVLMIGLSNSGKTTLLRSFSGRTDQIYPTAGFQIYYIKTGHQQALVYDCSGQGHSRPTWAILQQYCDAVIYVIDAHDYARFSIAKNTLNTFIDRNKSMKKKCLCIMLNKCDLQHKYDKQLLIKALDIDKMQKYVSKIYVKQTSGYNKTGIDECFQWISKTLHNNQKL